MRAYPQNSPHAAARIVALGLLADGRLDPRELRVLDEMSAHELLGLSHDAMRDVIAELCEDLLAEASAAHACAIDPYQQAQLLGEVTDPELRARVLSLCQAVVEADDEISEGEAIVLTQAVEHWGMERQMLAPH